MLRDHPHLLLVLWRLAWVHELATCRPLTALNHAARRQNQPAGAHGLQIAMQSLQMIICGRHLKKLHEPLRFLSWLQMQKLLRRRRRLL